MEFVANQKLQSLNSEFKENTPQYDISWGRGVIGYLSFEN
jgi:hypothetical protein